MRYLIAILAVTLTAGLLGACAESAQPKNEASAAVASTAPESPEKVQAEILQLEKDWVAAIISKDVGALDRLLASDFNGTSPTGSTFPKERAIEEIKAGAYSVEKMDLDEASVNVYGNTAVVFTSQQEKSKYDGKENSGHYHFTNVWVKRDGKWQVVASHGSRYQ
jgi:ketosteroid isomerase-like protein